VSLKCSTSSFWRIFHPNALKIVVNKPIIAKIFAFLDEKFTQKSNIAILKTHPKRNK